MFRAVHEFRYQPGNSAALLFRPTRSQMALRERPPINDYFQMRGPWTICCTTINNIEQSNTFREFVTVFSSVLENICEY